MRFITIILVLLILLSGCTLHFKGSEIELDAEPVLSRDISYDLTHIDILKNASSIPKSIIAKTW